MQIKGKVFLVTGAASGLGAATAKHLVEHGAKVILVDMNLQQGQAYAASLGAQARFVQLDVTDEQAAQQCFEQILAQEGALHGLVNCAGIGPSAKVLGREGVHDLALFARTLNINVLGSFNMLRLAAQCMAQNELHGTEEERGVIINTASVAAFDGQIGQVAYAASKGAVAAMTLPIARELAQHGIRIMTIAPGTMQTPMLQSLPEKVQQALGDMVPFPKRVGKPEEFAALVGHIVENPYLNGEVIRFDGAIRMAAK